MELAIFIAAVVVTLMIAGVVVRTAQMRRTRALARVAAERGFSFDEMAVPFSGDEMLSVLRFTQRRGVARNVMRGAAGGKELVVFDYRSPQGKRETVVPRLGGRGARRGSARLRVVSMRIGMVLGPGGALAKLTTPFRFFVGGPIGSGRQWVPWIHRDDAVRAIVAALADDRYTGPINLVTDSVRNADLSRALGKALGRPSWLPVPGFALRTVLGELADYALHGRRVVPRRLRELGFTWTYPNLDDALAHC
ncbi:MAG: DUF1731 domain-containing protein [Acidobacteriia bacterium]|nr:DUF1731 domain-containing protein [Terriglobia bacterium]